MRWIAFAILVYCVTVVQTAVAPFMAVNTIRPDLMVIVAVYYALTASKYDAMLACWIIGLVIDLTGASYTSGGNVGLYAFSFGLIAMIIVKVRDLTFRESPLTQVFFTAATKVAVAMLAGVHMLHRLDDWGRLGDVFKAAVFSAIYTAILAPYAHWLLRRLRTILGLSATRRIRVR